MSATLPYNISVQKQSDWTETVIAPATTEMSGMVATGSNFTEHYTGTPDALRTLRSQLLASASTTAQKTAVLRGLEGGMADLLVTTAAFVTQESLEPQPGGEGEEQQAEKDLVGTDFQIDVSYETVSILDHPRLKEYKDNKYAMAALQMVVNGAYGSDIIEVPNDSGGKTQMPLDDYIHLLGLEEAEVFARRSPTYTVPIIKYTASKKLPKSATLDVLQNLMKIVPGGGQSSGGMANPPAVPHRDWLYVGGGSRLQGNQIVMTKNWLLSNLPGWDKEIYP